MRNDDKGVVLSLSNQENTMSNVPGISPLMPDLEEVRHSDDEAFDEVTAPEAPAQHDADQDTDPANVENEDDA